MEKIIKLFFINMNVQKWDVLMKNDQFGLCTIRYDLIAIGQLTAEYSIFFSKEGAN